MGGRLDPKQWQRVRDLYAGIYRVPPYAEFAVLILMLVLGLLGWAFGK